MVEGYGADWFGFGCGGCPSALDADYDGAAAGTVECGCDDGRVGADAFELGDCCAVCICVYVCAERAPVDVTCVFVTPFVVTPTGRVRARARVIALIFSSSLPCMHASLVDRKSTRLNSSHSGESRMPSSA